ncbi:MAG: redoxin domain-containing protein [Planctomycetota bacterium]|nr:redoxin domain-containing protein [Planctomycetota bacterium]
MRILFATACLLSLLSAAAVLQADDLEGRPRPVKAAARGVGALVPDLTFEDLAGKAGRLSEFRDRKALVIAFTNAGCPVCKRYGPKLARMARTWAERDVAFLLVNPTPHEDVKVVRAAIDAHGLEARYVLDTDGRFAQALAGRTTAECFVLDASRTLRYRGAIDDQYGVGYALERATQPYLERALEAVVAGLRPEIEATTAPGCTLEVRRAKPDGRAVTWHEHVQRIVQARCQDCHREGENGPFALMTYADAKGNAPMIAYVVRERLMPPWFASDESLAMLSDHSLTARERSLLLRWVETGTPEGDPKDAPLPRTFTKGWKIGKPDAVLQIPKAFRVPAEGTVKYQYSTVSTDFAEDRWIQAFEIRPTAPQAVHHVLVFVRYPKDHPRAHEQPRPRGGVEGYFAAMVPGQSAFRFPAGTARFLPKGAQLRFQIHYTTNGQEAVDQTRIGFVFTKDGRPQHEMRSTGIYNLRLRIPAGKAHHVEQASRMLPIKARIHGFTPHMHVRGKAFHYEAVLPDGTRKTLLDIPRYDFNWQLHYRLAEPLELPAGTRIRCTAVYDNSAGNPANPNPNKTVRWGNQTWEEMLIGYVDWHPVK